MFFGRWWIHVHREERLNIFTLLEYEELKMPKPSYMLVGLPDTGCILFHGSGDAFIFVLLLKLIRISS
jgi:hypothetical protein